jgi:HAD superfamily hydrolase (TIGR01509 family)
MELEMKVLKQLRRYLWGPEKTDRPPSPRRREPTPRSSAPPPRLLSPRIDPEKSRPIVTNLTQQQADSRSPRRDTPALRPIVFDLGGVVLNWNPTQLIETVFPDLQGPNATSLAEEIFRTDTDDSDWLLFDKGLLSTSQVINRLVNRTGQPKAAFEQLIEEIADHLQPIPRSLEIMRSLKKNGHPLYFLSNMPEAYANFLIETQDFFAVFEDGMFSSSVNLTKPDSAIFKLAAERWEFVAPPIFIDDSKDNTSASESMGWHAIHFTNHASLVEHLANSGASLHAMRAA